MRAGFRGGAGRPQAVYESQRTGSVFGTRPSSLSRRSGAVYSISDPRANVFQSFVGKLSEEKHKEKEYKLYMDVAEIAKEVIADKRKIYKGVSPNVDFYSGFVYTMLDLPEELFTPMFAVARIAGWSAHRIEELINVNKIIRPAYKSIAENRAYTPIADR